MNINKSKPTDFISVNQSIIFSVNLLHGRTIQTSLRIEELELEASGVVRVSMDDAEDLASFFKKERCPTLIIFPVHACEIV